MEDISIPDDPRTAEADYALRISGDSMEPKRENWEPLRGDITFENVTVNGRPFNPDVEIRQTTSTVDTTH